MDDLREKLAELAHSQWAGWMRYLFEKSTVNTNGEVIIPVWAVDRWKRQTESLYSDLPEKEKDSDREEADRVIAIIEPELARLRAERDELRAAAEIAKDILIRVGINPSNYDHGVVCKVERNRDEAAGILIAALSRTEGGNE